MSDTEKYDVVIVGGGISGLYTAWRLASNTNYSIAVLEYSHRFGGRYRTCHMPGGFPAELGAMRFISTWHPMLGRLVDDMHLKTEKYYMAKDNEHTSAFYVRGNLIQEEAEMAKLNNFSDRDKQRYLGLDASYRAMELPENGNFFTATLAGSNQLARNVTLKQWWGESLNAGVINQKNLLGHSGNSLVAEAGIMQPFSDPESKNQLKCIAGGVEKLIDELVSRLKKLNVALLSSHPVTRVEELREGFKVKVQVNHSNSTAFSAEKLILACNARGIELITWISDFNRTTEMQRLLAQAGKEKVTKVYLTYKQAWWETSGMKCGYVLSDLPLAYVNLFGSRGTMNGYSTLMVYNFVDAAVFDGMNSEEEERYKNTEGEIPPEQVPSKVLVQNIQCQLRAVFGIPEIPEPVAVCITTWSKDPIVNSYYVPKVGINHNSLYWRSLRPFGDESDVFMIGDTFVAVDRRCIYTAWTEGALLTAERVLHKYFNLEPYMDGLCLENPWPEDD